MVVRGIGSGAREGRLTVNIDAIPGVRIPAGRLHSRVLNELLDIFHGVQGHVQGREVDTL